MEQDSVQTLIVVGVDLEVDVDYVEGVIVLEEYDKIERRKMNISQPPNEV